MTDSIVAELRRARHRSGHSLSRMASLTGLNLSQISQIENQNVDPRLSSVQALAAALDCELRLVPRHRAVGVASTMEADSGGVVTLAAPTPPSIAERLRIQDP